MTLFETEDKVKTKKVNTQPPRPDNFDLDLLFITGNTQLTEVFRYTVDLKTTELTNVSSYDVYINSNFVGSDLSTIQINDGDTLLINVTKIDNTKQSIIKTTAYLV